MAVPPSPDVANRKRRRPKKVETFWGIGVLMVLTGIGAGVFWSQYHFNPAVKTLSWPSAGVTESKSAPPGLIRPALNTVPLSPPEVFAPQDLSDKINGKADLYLTAGFKQLNCQRFKLVDAPDQWLELFVYDMGETSSAFAVFSSQRREDAQPIEIAQFSYRTENALFFVNGPYYVEIIASDASDRLRAAMELTAAEFIRHNQARSETIGEIALFPRRQLAAGSITLIPADAFGYQRLDRVFTAKYRLDRTDITLFVSRRKNAAEAEQLAASYHDFLITYGGESLPVRTGIEHARLVYIFDTYELIFYVGSFMAGIHEAADRRAAEEMSVLFYRHLKGALNEPR